MDSVTIISALPQRSHTFPLVSVILDFKDRIIKMYVIYGVCTINIIRICGEGMSISEFIMYNPWWNNSIDTETLVKGLADRYETANFKRNYSNLFDLSSNALYTLRGILKWSLSQILQS